MQGEVFMEETKIERKAVSIKETDEKIESQGICVTDILPLRALTGCDNVISFPDRKDKTVISVTKA